MSTSGTISSPSQQASLNKSHSRPAPFAFDSDFDETSSQYTFDSTGHRNSVSRISTARTGGSKESRLRRQAFHDDGSDADLVPVRIDNIPEKIPHEVLTEDFAKFGEIYDVKILLVGNGRNRGVGFVKFSNEEDAQSAVAHMTGKVYHGFHPYGEKRGLNCTRAHQDTFFSHNTGALGLTNKPVGEIYEKKAEYVAQSITLDECFSRSGYPYGSKHELRRLEPHAPVDINELHSLKLSHLPHNTTADHLRGLFTQYGAIGNVYIPKPLQVIEYCQHSSEANLGEAFVRFVHRRDMDKALAGSKGLNIEGTEIKIEHILPHYWPTKKTRTFF